MGDGACGGCSSSDNGGCSSGSCSITKQQQHHLRSICIKCKESPAVAVANQTESICTECLRTALLSKVKTVLSTHAMLTSQDKVLLAFSGGASSRVLLQLLCEIRAAALASRDLNAPAFSLEVAFIDEGVATGASVNERKVVVESVRRIVSEMDVPLHVVRLEDIMQKVGEGKGGDGVEPKERLVERCDMQKKGDGLDREKEVVMNLLSCVGDAKREQSYDREKSYEQSSDPELSKEDEEQQRCGLEKKLLSLLSSVSDPTGREDLIEMLRMESLDHLAQKMSFTKLMLGWSTTRIAARVVSATAKGRGFSLAAGVQYVDARWHAPVVLPLRDCASKDLALLCHHLQLETVFIRNSSTLADSASVTINSLCNNFVLALREDNSARDHTIVRTAGKLSQFGFNQLPSVRKRRGNAEKLEQLQHGEGNNVNLVFCALCRDPLDVDEDGSSSAEPCCTSCRFQILKDKQVFGLLPRHIQDRSKRDLLKSQIQEFLISDGEPAS